MASGTDLFNALQSRYPGVNLNTGGLMDEANKQAGQGITPDQFVQNSASFSQPLQAYNDKFQTLAQPAQDQINNAQNLAQGQSDINDQQNKLQTNQLNYNIGQTIQDINRNAAQQQTDFMNRQQQLGIRSSGDSQQGVAGIASQTTNTLNNVDMNRVNQLAELALQQAQSHTNLSAAIKDATDQRAILANNTHQQASDAYLQNDDRNWNRDLTLAQEGSKLPAGQTINVGPYSHIVGTGHNAQAAIDLFSHISPALMGDSGYQNLIKSALSSYGYNVDMSNFNPSKYVSSNPTIAPSTTPAYNPPRSNPSDPAGFYQTRTKSTQQSAPQAVVNPQTYLQPAGPAAPTQAPVSSGIGSLLQGTGGWGDNQALKIRR